MPPPLKRVSQRQPTPYPTKPRKPTRVRKVLSSHAAAFGKDFQLGLSHTACSIGALLSKGVLMPNGDVDLKAYGRLPKSHLWHYIYYLQHHNRHVKPIAAVLGATKRVTYAGLLALIGSPKTDRQALAAFIHRVVTQPDARVPFLKALVPATDIRTVDIASPLTKSPEKASTAPVAARDIAVGPTPDVESIIARVKADLGAPVAPAPSANQGPPLMIQPVVYPAKMDPNGDVRIKFDLNLAPLSEKQLRKLQSPRQGQQQLQRN